MSKTNELASIQDLQTILSACSESQPVESVRCGIYSNSTFEYLASRGLVIFDSQTGNITRTSRGTKLYKDITDGKIISLDV